MREQAGSTSAVPTVGYRLLYSVGINRRDDDGAFRLYHPNSSENDVVFPLKDDVRKD